MPLAKILGTRSGARATVLSVLAVVVMAASTAFAAKAVRLTDNLEGYRSQLVIESSSPGSVDFSVDAEAVGIIDDAVWNSGYKQVDLPAGETVFAGKLSEVGSPELPTLTTLIAIPDMAGVTVSASYESFEIIEDIDVMPVQTPEPEGGFQTPEPFAINQSAYSQDRFYPGVLAEAGEPMILRDVRVTQIATYPVQYNPVRHQLKVYRNISVELSFDGDVVNPKTVRHTSMGESFLPLYRAFIANFDEYMNTLAVTDVRRGSIIFITPNIGNFLWTDEIQVLADWKRQKGYDVVVVPTTDINSSGRPTNTQIKQYIQDAYDSWEVPPEYVCIVGDENLSSGGFVVPDYPFSYFTSDHAYSLVDGTDWLPDIGVARASVDNTVELNTWIAKALKYEKNPDIMSDPQYWRRAIMVAGAQQTVTCAWTVLWVKERLEEIGFVHIDTVLDRGSDPPDYLITNPITAGVGYVNYRGWAGADGWWDPSYQLGALNQCQNVNKPGVMTSIVCGTGDYGDATYDPCFGETWIRMGTPTLPRGGPSYFGATDHGTHTKWNNPITIGFYFGLINRGIYHFTQAAIAGKLNQYVNYPREASTIQQYFNTYNMLGDPELEMRLKTPMTLNVTHPATIEAGVNAVEINVLGGGMSPVEGAYVTLIKRDTLGAELFYSVAKTDANGTAVLSAPTDTPGDLILTVTARDFHPFIDNVTILQADETVGLESYQIDDTVYGDGSGQLNPAETVELALSLRNFGLTAAAQNVVAMLTSSADNLGVVHRSQVNYGTILPGEIGSGDGDFVIMAKPYAADGEEALFQLVVTSDVNPGGWTSFVRIPVVAPRLTVSSVTVSDNGRLDPAETADLTIQLRNSGDVGVLGLSGIVETQSGYVHVLTAAPVGFGDIAPGGVGSNTVAISVSVDAGTFEGRNIPFVLRLTSSSRASYDINFNLTVGLISGVDPTGPDAHGYYVFDNADAGFSEQPTYAWMELYGNGGQDRNLYDDSKTMMILPFEFTYYGESFNRITICSNGWICPDSTQWVSFRNWRLPDPTDAKGMIAGFWDDLGPTGYQDIYTYFDTTNHRYMIEWYQVVHRDYTSARQTFQIVIYDPAHTPTITGDAVVELVYNTVANVDGGYGENYATVGWEDMTETRGLSISYSNVMAPGCASLVNGRVYRITTNNGRGGVSGSVLVNDGSHDQVRVETSTGQWQSTVADGVFRILDVPPGQVDIAYSKEGWFPHTLTSVSVTANAITPDQDVMLAKCPVPSELAASEGLNDHVNLTWTEVDHPDLAGYDIYRSDWENGLYTKINDGPVVGSTYDDYTTVGENIYWYYIAAVYSGADYDAASLASNKDDGSNADITAVDETPGLPQVFAMSQNYPNPFNARTVISYSLPKSGQVELEVFNILGQSVRTLVNEYQQAGFKSVIWDGKDASGDQVTSGVYFYRIATPSEQITKRMVLLK